MPLFCILIIQESSYRNRMQSSKKNLDKLDNLAPLAAWKELVGGKEQMDEEAFSLFITQTLGLSEDSILQFYIITIGMKAPKLGHVKYQNFEHLFRFLGNCKTVKDLKKIIPKMEKEVSDPKVFKQVYRTLFDVFLIKNLSMQFQFAQELWSLLLQHDFVYLKQFQQYLKHLGAKKPTKCHKDLWNMMHEFALVVKDIKSDYKEGDAWPVFLDNFVQYMKEQNIA